MSDCSRSRRIHRSIVLPTVSAIADTVLLPDPYVSVHGRSDAMAATDRGGRMPLSVVRSMKFSCNRRMQQCIVSPPMQTVVHGVRNIFVGSRRWSCRVRVGKAGTAFCVAAPGTTTAGTAVPLTVTGTRRITATTGLASVFPEPEGSWMGLFDQTLILSVH